MPSAVSLTLTHITSRQFPCAVPISCHPSWIMQLKTNIQALIQQSGRLLAPRAVTHSVTASSGRAWPPLASHIGLYSNLLTYTNTHFLSDRTAGVFDGGERVSFGWKSDRATFTPIKSVSSQEHLKGTLQGTLFTSLSFLSFFFILST